MNILGRCLFRQGSSLHYILYAFINFGASFKESMTG